MKRLPSLRSTGLIAFALFIVGSLLHFVNNQPVYALSNDIIINEIHYNPDTGGNQNFEFIELYNKTSNTVDVSGWCFTEGISFCFPADSSISGLSYVVLSPSAVDTLILYQVNTVGTYSGNLSNGGETLTLNDDQDNPIATLSYTDEDPWPVSPDGYGPSMELIDPSLDSALSESWAASNGPPTPGRVNSVYNQDQAPLLTDLSELTDIEASDSPTVTVSAPDSTSVNLYYKFDFENEVTVIMNDSGTGADITSGDGVWSAIIPPHTAGSLVRYRVEASNELATSRLPDFNDVAMNYEGYAVKDPTQTSDLPIIQWFMKDEDFDDLMQNHVFDDTYLECVIVYGDQFFDNSEVKIKGELSLTFPKKSFKFKLPKTHKIDIPGQTDRPISEFHMNAEWLDQTRARTLTAWQVAKEIGIETPSFFSTRLLRNNQHHGLFLFFEKYETEYQEEKSLDDGLFVEDFSEKVTDAGSLQDMEDWRSDMLATRTPQKREYVLEEHDIPNFINFMAFQALINNSDWYSDNNLFTYKDINGDNRWRLLPYDLDITLVNADSLIAITPYFTSYYYTIEQHFQTTPLYDELDLREMYFRRLRTLVDQYFSNDQLKNKYLQNVAFLATETEEDIVKWPTQVTNESGTLYTSDNSSNIYSIDKHKQNLTVRFVNDRAIPASQVSQPNIEIEEVYSNSSGTNQYIKLTNNNNYAVDISNWSLIEADYTFKPGSVIPSNSSIYINRDDIVFKDQTNNTIVLGTLGQDIPLNGFMTLLRDDNSVVDSVNYTFF